MQVTTCNCDPARALSTLRFAAVEEAYNNALKILKGSTPKNPNLDAMYDNSLLQSIKKENR
jgi:hypothetical protein